MSRHLKDLIVLIAVISAAAACQCAGPENTNTTQQTARERQNQIIEAERNFLKKEREAIQAYIDDRGLDMQRSGTGLYYSILSDSVTGYNAQSEDLVNYHYTISLLNGTELYQSTQNIIVDRQDAELGLHEAIKKIGVGDKGLFILPSHLAFGVAGDLNKIPPKTPLVYTIEILKIQKNKS